MVCRSLDEHAPTLTRGLVEFVDLERHLVLGVGDAGAQVLVRVAVRHGPKYDRSLEQHVVDREDGRAVPAGEREPPDPARGDQPQAFRFLQSLQNWLTVSGLRRLR